MFSEHLAEVIGKNVSTRTHSDSNSTIANYIIGLLLRALAKDVSNTTFRI